MLRWSVACVLSIVVVTGACGGDGLTDEAPTQLRELAVDGGHVRVAALGDGIAVAWQHPMTGAGTLARYDAALQQLWRVDFGAGQPLAVRAWGDRIVALAAEEIFAFDADGTVVGQWPVSAARDIAVVGARLLALTDDAVVELDATGAQIATHPVDPEFTTGWSLEASTAGYCPTGLVNDDNVTTCFGWDGVQSPVSVPQPSFVLSAERDFAVLADDGVVSAFSFNPNSDLKIVSQQLADGRFVGEHAFEYDPQADPHKVFLGPDDRLMWLELEDWCDDNCHIGFRVGLTDPSRAGTAWRTDLFAVLGTVGNMWTATADDERIYVASDRAVYVVSND